LLADVGPFYLPITKIYTPADMDRFPEDGDAWCLLSVGETIALDEGGAICWSKRLYEK
jgi:hypothetical protein